MLGGGRGKRFHVTLLSVTEVIGRSSLTIARDVNFFKSRIILSLIFYLSDSSTEYEIYVYAGITIYL